MTKDLVIARSSNYSAKYRILPRYFLFLEWTLIRRMAAMAQCQRISYDPLWRVVIGTWGSSSIHYPTANAIYREMGYVSQGFPASGSIVAQNVHALLSDDPW